MLCMLDAKFALEIRVGHRSLQRLEKFSSTLQERLSSPIVLALGFLWQKHEE